MFEMRYDLMFLGHGLHASTSVAAKSQRGGFLNSPAEAKQLDRGCLDHIHLDRLPVIAPAHFA